ncbi:hypothetical protein D3C84_1272040 [compost metagenome]
MRITDLQQLANSELQRCKATISATVEEQCRTFGLDLQLTHSTNDDIVITCVLNGM